MEVVSFEIAKKLKEKGFNDNCHAYYEPLKHCFNFSRVFKTNSLVENYKCVTAPTISQVLKWLREEKKIYLELVIVVDAEYMCDIYKFDVKPIECLGSTDYFKTYELAAIAGINYVIDNLI